MGRGDGLPWVWGVPVEPAGLPTPEVAPGSRLAIRAVAMEAPREIGFLWLCQMRRAPYSYDWLDNFGRRSPRRADPSLTDLAVGQSFMTIFELVDFTDSESLTLRMKAVVRPGSSARSPSTTASKRSPGLAAGWSRRCGCPPSVGC